MAFNKRSAPSARHYFVFLQDSYKICISFHLKMCHILCTNAQDIVHNNVESMQEIHPIPYEISAMFLSDGCIRLLL